MHGLREIACGASSVTAGCTCVGQAHACDTLLNILERQPTAPDRLFRYDAKNKQPRRRCCGYAPTGTGAGTAKPTGFVASRCVGTSHIARGDVI